MTISGFLLLIHSRNLHVAYFVLGYEQICHEVSTSFLECLQLVKPEELCVFSYKSKTPKRQLKDGLEADNSGLPRNEDFQ